MMTKKDIEDFENSANWWTCDNAYVDGIVEVRDQCHITGKYGGSSERECNIIINIILYSCDISQTKNYDLHLIMQDLGTFSLKMSQQMDQKKYMGFSISNKLSFIDSFQFLHSQFLLDSSVKNLGKDDFKYSSQEFDNNVLDLVKEKGFYSYEYMSNFEKFKEQSAGKENFSSSLTGQETSDKDNEHVLKVWDKFETNMMEDYHNLYLKCDMFLLADVFE